jgi:muramoyltetrapeptide carboxypeptidase
LRRCARLEAGDTIGIIAPAGPVKQEELEQGVQLIQSRGYRVALGDHVLATMQGNSYLAGTDALRAYDLNEMFARKDVKAVFSARGGYGSMRLFDRLDYDILRDGPKVFAGYSDITSLHLALTQQAGYVTFYSPNVTSLPHLDALSQEVFWNLLESLEPYGPLPAPPDAMQTLVPGIVEGKLAGGCLCLLAHACASRHTPDFKNKLVLIEDVHEAIYRVDRDLTQLRNAGAFDEAAGFILGSVSHWQKNEADPPDNTLETLWRDFFLPLGKPTISGFPFGHEPNPLTLPLGVRARLDASTRTVTLLEPAVK